MKRLLILILAFLTMNAYSQSRIRKGFNAIHNEDTVSLLYSNGVWTLDSDTILDIEVNSITLSDGVKIDSTVDFKPFFQSEEFDSIKTKQLRITDSLLIIEDLPNRKENHLIYYNTSTGKISYNEIAKTYGAFTDSSTTIPLSITNTYYQITNGDSLFGVLVQNGITWLDSDTLQLLYDGDYIFDFGLTSIADDTDTFRLRLYNVTKTQEIPIAFINKGRNSINFLTIMGKSYCNFCESNDKIVIEIANIGNTDNDFIVISGYIYGEKQ